ncbi:putative nuclease HARBI1 [Schistocerca nitens]|uniref:putative nuclease HARBI1 n=1 Tax=Schistocerca nitens TaxID=7011 RepID=UPI002118CF51|nr:putative nuclease HARBI1 [Schistocerca nitens]
MSSESETDFLWSDEELEMLQPQKRQRIENYVEDVVPQYNDREFVEHFRVRRHVADDLCERFRNSRFYNYRAGGNGKLLPLQHILIFLWFAGHEAAGFRDVADRFNICISSLRCVIQRVTNFISDLGREVIKWPSAEERGAIEAHFRGNGLPGAIGAIDGSHIRIDRPRKDPQSYMNRKNYFSIQLQVVCDQNRRIRDLFVGYPGSVHDGRVFRTSTLYHTIEEKCGDFHILGDSAYPCTRNLLTPFRNTGNMSRVQCEFNRALSKNRCVVEHCFGLLKQRFRQLYHLKLRSAREMAHFIRACCVLHNLAVEDNLELEDNEGEEDDAPAEERVVGFYNRDDRSGIAKRNMIAAQLQM